MKQIIVLGMLLILALNSVGQLTASIQSKAETDYLKRSRTQKTFAWILTGAGVGIVAIGLATQDYVDAFTGLAGEKNKTSPATYAVGGACIAGGIVLFVASAKNKKRAAGISFLLKMERPLAMHQSLRMLNDYPAGGIRINLH